MASDTIALPNASGKKLLQAQCKEDAFELAQLIYDIYKEQNC